jgi:hypothetical protein
MFSTMENEYYKIFDFDNNIHNFENTIHSIYLQKYGNFGELSQLHTVLYNFDENTVKYINEIKHIGINDRNTPFIKDFYNFIDSDPSFFSQYCSFLQTYIRPLLPKDNGIIYQTTPNIRISLPNSTAIGRRGTDPSPGIIGLHCDADFHHPPEEINVVIPLTPMFSTNSIYFEPYPNSMIEPRRYNNLCLKSDEFFCGYLNKLLHYNRVNDTNQTRMSLDFRLIPLSKWVDREQYSVSSHKSMQIGDYYSVLMFT